MKKYLSFFRIRFIAGLQYRAAAWAGIATQFAWGGMTILMFWAFYQSGENNFPMTFPQLSSYIWMQQAFLAMFMAWFFDNDIFESITSGSIAYELCRPCDVYAMWFVKNMAIRLSRVVLRCFPILLAAAFLPAPFNITLPPGWLSGVLFLASVTFGFLVLISSGNVGYRVFCGCNHTDSVFPGSPAADSVCAALCFHAKYAVSDLYRTYKWL